MSFTQILIVLGFVLVTNAQIMDPGTCTSDANTDINGCLSAVDPTDALTIIRKQAL